MKRKYIIDTIENKQFFAENVSELLSFGVNFPAPGGGSFYLGGDGQPMEERGVETWITCRMAHVYSIGTTLNVKGADELAKKALEGLKGRLHDSENGGWYQGINADGSKMENKQCYSHAFVILAASSALLAKIDGAKDLLDEALTVFDKYFWDEENGLAVDTWDTSFSCLDPYRGINANMHTVEAFLAVADATGDVKYLERAGRIVNHVIAWAKNNDFRIPEHFHENWEVDLEMNSDKKDDPFKPYGATCGHGIEWARLITQWASSYYSKDAKTQKEYVKMACMLFERAIKDGWNRDGAKGIVYTTDWNGRPVVRDRMHWTLAEAINTAAILYRATGRVRYAGLFSKFCEYLDDKVMDHNCGSWFHQLDEKNTLKETVWPGKSDLYHAFQSMLIPYLPIEKSIAAAVKEEGFVLV